jgi:hypothetical protein
MGAALNDQEFLRHYAQNAERLMWFLGAGASRTAGLPTANDITWDLKRKCYCAAENQDIQSHDVNNKAIRSKIQSNLDSRGFPPLWDPREYSFYFELTFGKDLATQQKYLSDALSTQKVSLTVGHRALAALLSTGRTRVVFTTNFDEVIESAYASVAGKSISAFHLEGSYAALDALNAERFPLYVKLHGDFRYQSVKNLSDDLLSNDLQLQRCFVAAAARYGLVVSGYSGRDANVMAMFKQALEQNNAFPHGFMWTTPRLSNVTANVNELIAFAKSKGVRAHVVETGTFDEMLSKIWRQIPNKPDGLDQKVRTAAAQPTSIKLPPPGTAFPLLRTNALLVKAPAQCGTIDYAEPLTYHDVKERIVQTSPDAVIAFTDRVLFWGNNTEVAKVVKKDKIRGFGAYSFDDPAAAITDSPFLKSFFEDGLSRALCDGKPLLLRKKDRTYYAVARHDAVNDDIYRPLRDVLGYQGKPGYITGPVPGMAGVSWAEATSLRLEERNGSLWLLVRPDIWISPLANRMEATDFLRAKRLKRYNNQANEILSAWISVLLGKVGNADSVRVTGFPGADQQAVFEISTRTAYSRGS